MRDILFRGKRVGDGVWVYGYFVQQGEDTYIFEQEEVDKGVDLGGYLDCCRMREVIPETVGQWCGLRDKDGVYIFDGDILAEHERWCVVKPEIKTVYEIKNLGSGFFYRETGHEYWTSMDDWEFGLCIDDSERYEVLGNIHDNLEIMGEKNNGR